LTAADAIDNMDGAELYGRVLRCNLSKPPSSKLQAGKAIWSTEEFHAEDGAEAEKTAAMEE
jgi:hypothetical protein